MHGGAGGDEPAEVTMDDEEKKDAPVASLDQARSKARADNVIRLADEITKLLGEQQLLGVQSKRAQFDFSCDQLVAVELSVQTLMHVIRSALGDEEMGKLHMEAQHRLSRYVVRWPTNSQPYYVNYMKEGASAPAEVVSLY